jgi:hypothetical protein
MDAFFFFIFWLGMIAGFLLTLVLVNTGRLYVTKNRMWAIRWKKR